MVIAWCCHLANNIGPYNLYINRGRYVPTSVCLRPCVAAKRSRVSRRIRLATCRGKAALRPALRAGTASIYIFVLTIGVYHIFCSSDVYFGSKWSRHDLWSTLKNQNQDHSICRSAVYSHIFYWVYRRQCSFFKNTETYLRNAHRKGKYTDVDKTALEHGKQQVGTAMRVHWRLHWQLLQQHMAQWTRQRILSHISIPNKTHIRNWCTKGRR